MLEADVGDPWIYTCSGRFWPLDPQTEDVSITDVAQALCRSRWLNHTSVPITIAEHSVRVSWEAGRQAASVGKDRQIYGLVGLLHDAAEAYLPDMPAPLKPLVFVRQTASLSSLVSFDCVESNVLYRIHAALQLAFPFELFDDPIVHEADRILAATEVRDLIPHSHCDPVGAYPLPDRIVPWDRAAAYHAFLARWRDLR